MGALSPRKIFTQKMRAPCIRLSKCKERMKSKRVQLMTSLKMAQCYIQGYIAVTQM